VHVEVVPTESLAARAAVWIADRVWTAWADRGSAHLAVSGGTTPAAMFGILGGLALPWDRLHVWQVDERVAPDGDPDRNAGQLAPLAAAGAHVHLMEVTDTDLERAAVAYAGELHVACGGVLDVVHLGLGDDGHTASWAPGDPVIGVESTDVAVTRPYRGHVRVTLTRPPVNRARAVCFLVAGAAKAPAVARLLTADPAVPASAVRTDRATCLLDPPAAGQA
jgi:6-phosphogluconolactonase